MDAFVTLTISGIVAGGIYAVAASGLVLTYATTGVFNFGHGAVGMIMAFLHWQLLEWGVPQLLSLAVVLLVAAPVAGLLIHRYLARGLHRAATDIQLIVTIALTVGLIGVAQTIWDPSGTVLRSLFGDRRVELFGLFVSWDEIFILVIAAVVALLLWLGLTRVRAGVALRAVVDDRDQAALSGIDVEAAGRLSWVLGSVLAGLAGVLFAPLILLEAIVLTFLVVNAYAAATAGRLTSLPLTFAGALALGLIESYASGYLPSGYETLDRLRTVLPAFLLFVVVWTVPSARYGSSGGAIRTLPKPPSYRRLHAGLAALIAVAAVLAAILPSAYVLDVSQGLAFAVVMLSIMIVTGLGGQVSLAPLTFAALGAFAMARVGEVDPLLGLLAATVIAIPIGVLVALPAMRLRHLYLALSTFAFAIVADQVLIQNTAILGDVNLNVPRLAIGPLDLGGDRVHMVVLAVVFAVAAVLVIALRRSLFGQQLAAMRDSETAVETLGANTRALKLGAFVLSAAMGGLGGAMIGSTRVFVGSFDFQPFNNLPVFLLAVVGGVTTVTGSLVGGLLYAALPALQARSPTLGGLAFLVIGLAAVSLSRQPDGLVGVAREAIARMRATRQQAVQVTRQLLVDDDLRGASVTSRPLGPAAPVRLADRANGSAPIWTGPAPALELIDVNAGYGGIGVLHDLNLRVPFGTVVAVVGPNGMGKSTMLKVSAGLLTPNSGHVHIAGQHVNTLEPHRRARAGVALIPDFRGVFPKLTVRENLEMFSYAATGVFDVDAAYERFPRLAERATQQAGTLSGGEQQMLAIARALATSPRLLLLDELSTGLAPMIVDDLYDVVRDIAREGMAIVLAEQFADVAFDVADFGALLMHGRIVDFDEPTLLKPRLAAAYVGH